MCVGTVFNGGCLGTLKASHVLAHVRVINAKIFKKEKKKSFSKGKKTEIIVNWTARHTLGLSWMAVRNFSLEAPQQTCSCLRFCSFFFFVAWWPRRTLRSQVSFRVVWGPHGPSQTIYVRAWSRIPVSPAPRSCKRQSIPFFRASHTVSISTWLRLTDCFAVFLSPLSVGEGEAACASSG